MRHRVAELVGPVTRAMWVCTFHAACVRILRAHGDRLGYPRTFSIYDQADSQRLAGYVVRDLNLDAKRFPPRAAHGQISLWKNELISPQQAVERRRQHLRTQARRHLHRLPGPPVEGRGDGLRRPVDEDGRTVPRLPRCARALSTAVPARADRRVPRHQHGAERDCPAGWPRSTNRSRSSATTTRACTASAAPTCATSPSSKRRSTTSPRSCSTRTTAARRPSSTPPTRSSPTTPTAKTSSCGASSAPASGSCAITPKTRATKRRGWRARCSRCRATRRSCGRRWPPSTAPTRRAGSSKSR